jgi:hypothetical protein
VHHTITPSVVSPSAAGLWTYTADLSSGEVMTGDGFTIFDFAGYVSDSIFAPTGWTATVQLTGSVKGVAPPGATPDNPALENLLFTYTASSPIGPTNLKQNLGLFGASTTDTLEALGGWSSKDHAPDGSVADDHADRILVPAAARVPDGGATVALLGIALTGLEAMRRLIRARKA